MCYSHFFFKACVILVTSILKQETFGSYQVTVKQAVLVVFAYMNRFNYFCES